ncbi:uncharacterized protein LOC126830165 [Patella vulgata]|uniref:uncharacterized protein LOC126830165 n=1 Tax=Patella vulgata TaxID=6465 RepID=UPI0024A8B58C|nr:uncharacterized protein LOC126830165 [Patella vulgata]
MERESRCCLTLLFFVISLKADVSASCTFPPGLEGTFDSTREGTLEFNTTTYGKFTISTQSQTFPELEFECHIHSGTQYVSKSAAFTIFSSDFYAYMCLDINQVSSNLYYYYYGTQPLPQANNARVKIYPISTVVDSVNNVCDETTPYTQPYSILLKNDSIVTEDMQTLPADLLGYFNYVLDDGSANSCENQTTYLDTCTNTSTLMFDYNICNRTTMYSDSGVLYCLYYDQPTPGTYYVTLYNNDTTVDNTNTFRYTCVIFEKGSDISYATQYPLECLNSTFMNSTTVNSPGGTLKLTHNGSCRK